MSPLPVRVDVKARRAPSGEYIGRDSVAGCETRSRASPPAADTSQMSPPLTNAIVEPSAEIPGSASDGTGGAPSFPPCAAMKNGMTRIEAHVHHRLRSAVVI